MPFVVGILASSLDEVNKLPMDEVLIVDLDQNSFQRTPGFDDIELIPTETISYLCKALKQTVKVIKSKSSDSLQSFTGSSELFPSHHILTGFLLLLFHLLKRLNKEEKKAQSIGCRLLSQDEINRI